MQVQCLSANRYDPIGRIADAADELRGRDIPVAATAVAKLIEADVGHDEQFAGFFSGNDVLTTLRREIELLKRRRRVSKQPTGRLRSRLIVVHRVLRVENGQRLGDFWNGQHKMSL